MSEAEMSKVVQRLKELREASVNDDTDDGDDDGEDDLNDDEYRDVLSRRTTSLILTTREDLEDTWNNSP
jgi:hypothetical protein